METQGIKKHRLGHRIQTLVFMTQGKLSLVSLSKRIGFALMEMGHLIKSHLLQKILDTKSGTCTAVWLKTE